MAEILERDLPGDLELGDRMPYGTVELIVRRTDDEHDVLEVGLAVEQQKAKPKRRIPIFQSRSELLAIWKDWQKRKRAEKNAALSDQTSSTAKQIDDRTDEADVTEAPDAPDTSDDMIDDVADDAVNDTAGDTPEDGAEAPEPEDSGKKPGKAGRSKKS